MKKIFDSYRYSIWLCLWGILGLFSQFSYAAPDIVAQNYASARSSGMQSCTVGYDLMAGDVSYGQSFINGALPYSLNYRAPLRQNLSAAQTFSQPESSSLGWTDNYQAHVFVQNITSTTTENTQYTARQVGTNPVRYELITKTPVTRANISAKQIWIRLPGESTDTVFKEENGSFTRLYSADAIQELNNYSVQSLPWSSDLGEYQLSRLGSNLIIVKNGVKYTVSDNSFSMSPAQTYTDIINVYLNKDRNLTTTRASWHFFSFGIPADAISNTDLLIKTDTTVSMQLYRVAKIENQGRVLNLQYDNNMNLTQVSDVYNNKLVLEHNFHDASTGASQTIDESRLVTKVTYFAAQGGSQVASFNYQAYANVVPSTGTNTTVFALISSDSTAAGASSYDNEMTEIGAIKAYVASKGRTADSSYYYPVLKQVKNALGQIVRQWDITQNYVLGSGTSYNTAQTTLRSYTPLASGTAQDFTATYDDIAKTINLSVLLNTSTVTSTIQSTVNSDSSLTVTATGYPCLTSNGQPVNSAEFTTSRSRLTKVTNGNNVATAYEYDPQNRITGVTEADGTSFSRKTSYTYGALNNNNPNVYATPTSITTPNLTITNEVNPRGQIVTQTQTSSQAGSTSKVTSYVYEENSSNSHFARMLSVDGPRAGTADKINSSYDAFGYLASQSQVVNGATRTTQYLGYNHFGQPERIVSPNGVVQQFTYNNDGTLASQTTGVGGTSGTITGQTTTYTYNALKQKTSETNPDGETTQFEYDEAGRLIKKVLANGSYSKFSYYPIGILAYQMQVTSAGSSSATYYQYLNSRGLVSITQQGGSAARRRVTYYYDNNGNLARTTTSAGITEKWSYDALNRVTAHTDGEGNIDTKGYDVNDNVTLAKDALSAGTNPYSYRNGNVLTQEVNSDYGTKTYSYNEADQLTQSLHIARKCNYNNLDELGRATQYLCGANTGTTSGVALHNFNYTYDQSRFSRLDKVSSNDSTYGVDTTYEYDEYDRLTGKIQLNKAAAYWTKTTTSLKVGYSYSLAGKLNSMTLPSGRVLSYVYASNNKMLSNINYNGNALIRTIGYNGANRVTSWKWGNSGNAAYSQAYQTDDTTTVITNKDNNSAINYSLNYSYDNDGRITQISRQDGSIDNYSYDNVDRLVSENRTGNSNYNINYSYDRNGNRTALRATGDHQQRVASVDYSYTGNKLTAMTGESPTYTSYAELAYGSFSPIYDYVGNRRYNKTLGGDSLAPQNFMVYNHKNERTIRAFTRDNISWKTNTIQYMYDEESHLIGEYDAYGTPLVEYVWLGDKPIIAIYGNGAATKIYNIVTDAQNTPRRLIDSSNQAIVWAWDSTAFGVGQAQGNIIFNLRFPGQYYDELTKQHYNHNRFYNPELGRYMEADPIGLEGGLNPYAYAGSNPVMNVDPSGLAFQEIALDALRNSNNGMPSIPEPIYQALMGAANSASFGMGQSFSNWLHGYPTANMDASAYKIGEYGSVIGGLGGLAVKGARSVIKQASTSVWDMTSPTISRTILRESEPSIIRADTFFQGARYTDKVKAQVSSGDFHSFPQSIDAFASSGGNLTRFSGGDKLYRWKLELSGSYRGKDGVFEYIRNHDGTINHRFFRSNK